MDNEVMKYAAVGAMILYLLFLIFNNRDLFK